MLFGQQCNDDDERALVAPCPELEAVLGIVLLVRSFLIFLTLCPFRDSFMGDLSIWL